MIIKKVTRGLLDALYPPVCALCGKLSDGIYPHCCPNCFHSFTPITGSCCERCGKPFAGKQISHRCLACIKGRPPFAWCRGLYLYEGALAGALSGIKYGGRIALLDPLSDAFVKGMRLLEPLPSLDLVVPVPLSRRASWRRGFNQSFLLADLAARHLGLKVRSGALQRRGGHAQVGLTARERDRNAAASFMAGRSLRRAAGKRILLVDDVYTTGATVRACARILRGTGAEVFVLTLARASSCNWVSK
jgi:ComF family protein